MTLLTTVHVLTGSLAVLSGFAALLAPKGRPLHRGAGRLFLLTMTAMAASGTALAWLKPMPISVIAGLLTLYLLASAWMALRAAHHRPWAIGFLVVAGALTGTALSLALSAPTAPGTPDTESAEAFYFFVGVAGLAGVLDLRLALQPRLTGRHRLARHLWRMGFALFLSAGSLFTGPGARLFPASWQGSAWMSLPELLVLVTLLGWLFGLALGPWWRARP